MYCFDMLCDSHVPTSDHVTDAIVPAVEKIQVEGERHRSLVHEPSLLCRGAQDTYADDQIGIVQGAL